MKPFEFRGGEFDTPLWVETYPERYCRYVDDEDVLDAEIQESLKPIFREYAAAIKAQVLAAYRSK